MAHAKLPSDVPVRYLPRSKSATTLAGAMFFVGLNLLVDIVQGLLDPRARRR